MEKYLMLRHYFFQYCLQRIFHTALRNLLLLCALMQVPVIHQAGLLSVMDIALRLQDLQVMAEEGHVHQEDLEGMILIVSLRQQSQHSGPANLGLIELIEHVCANEMPVPCTDSTADIFHWKRPY